MKLPIYPVILILVVAIIGGVAVWKGMSTHGSEGAAIEDVREVDGDGDYDGDPIIMSEEEEGREESASPSGQAPEPSPAPTPAPKPSGYTLAQVSAHASAQSCWTAIGGNVYDLTAWISKHPGGKSAILGLCGKDGTQAFNREHGGQSRPEQELASFKIGALI